jgi:hypothetical protein
MLARLILNRENIVGWEPTVQTEAFVKEMNVSERIGTEADLDYAPFLL